MNSALIESMWGQKGKRDLANENKHYENRVISFVFLPSLINIINNHIRTYSSKLKKRTTFFKKAK